MAEPLRPIVVSCGDPGGIGLEIAFAAWSQRDTIGRDFVLLCDPDLVARRAERSGIDCLIEIVDADRIGQAPSTSTCLRVLPLESGFTDTPGRPDPANATGIVEAITRGTGCVFDGHAAALVTLPISKAPLYEAGFPFPGHTEYLGELCTNRTGEPVLPVMMLAGPQLRTVPVTVHIPLSAVPASLDPNLLERTIRITEHDLRTRFGIDRPRIAVAGLNPHAGESGKMGREDVEMIEPVIRSLAADGMAITGPLPADTMFHERARRAYDVAICMYHDQALIPAKTLGFDDAVNVTLGLPIIRTSPDHGTAFDIAGKGIARPDSFLAALRMADQMDRHARKRTKAA